MEIRFHEKLYRDRISEFQLTGIRRKIKKRSPKLDLFLITLPLGSQGMLEIYWYPELLQPFYQQLENELIVVGVAWTRQSAFSLVRQIVEEAGTSAGNMSMKEYFEEST